MNTVTIVVAVILVIVIFFAVWGSYRTLRTESCCDDDKNCCSCKTKHCSILKEDAESVESSE